MGLGVTFSPKDALSKKKRMMKHIMSNPRELKLRWCADYLVGINGYLSAFPGEKESYDIGDNKLRKILLNSTSNGWSNQAYVQGFGCEYITFENMSICLNTCKLRKCLLR